jgi:hypothetical protein
MLMRMLRLTIGAHVLTATLEQEQAPRTCEAIRRLLPLRSKVIHVRWSGEAIWIPLGDQRLGIDFENNTSYPAPGEIILYPGGVSEMEILIAYGPTCFASKAGQLSGNHFATIQAERSVLQAIGRQVLLEGAQDILIEAL